MKRQADAPVRGAILLVEVAERTDMLEVACGKCSRAGRLSVAKLIGQHGPEMPMTILLRVLSADFANVLNRQFSDRCGASYPQLSPWFMTNGSDVSLGGGGVKDQVPHTVCGMVLQHAKSLI